MSSNIECVRKARRYAALGILFAPREFLDLHIDDLLAVCNGCGAANAKFDFVPDRIYGTGICEACNIHDFMYSVGKTIEDKDAADRVFMNNMFRLIEKDKHKWYKPTMLQRRRALKYYEGVVAFGGDAYWSDKN